MLEMDFIISTAITAGYIFFQFSIITSLLQIKTRWWATLLYSVILSPMNPENFSPLEMLFIFYGSTFVYYIVASRKELYRVRFTVLAIAIHHFSSMLINNLILLIFATLALSATLLDILSSFASYIIMSVYIILLIIIKCKKIHLVNLTRDKIFFMLSSTMIIVAAALHTNIPTLKEVLSNPTGVFRELWIHAVPMVVITYMAFVLNKFSTKIEDLEFEALYISTLKESLENMQEFKHTSRNMVNSLLGYCDMGDLKSIEECLQELAHDMRHDINVETINVVIKKHMPYLYGIIVAKSALSATGQIGFEIDISATTFELKALSKVQVIKIVGNLMNNAFEAAKQSAEKEVTLEISNVMDERLKIVIANSIDAPVDTTMLATKGYSTKEGHTGLGIYEIQSIIGKQRKAGLNPKFNYYCDSSTFTAELLV